jgi:hypothetical protein
MTVHHHGALRAGLVTTLAMLAIVGYRGWRVSRAEHVEGRIQRVEAYNDRCEGKRGGNCTVFIAHVAYEVRGTTHRLFQPIGSVHGYDRPVSEARRRIGDTMTVSFKPDDPAVHYNGRWRVAPLVVRGLLIVGVVLIVVGLKPPADKRPRA